MAIRSDRPIYELVEKHLKLNPQPMTCTDLMEIEEVRTEALNEFGGVDRNVQHATNKLNDVLSFMRRRSLVIRYPSITKGKARFAYEWTKKKQVSVKPIKPLPAPSSAKTPMQITERDGFVEIELVNQDDRAVYQTTQESCRPTSFKGEKVMNIDYAQILKNATARQQALEALESELSEVDAIREHLALAERRAQQLLDAYKALDQEGRSLLGPLANLLGYSEIQITKIKGAKDIFANVVDLINKES